MTILKELCVVASNYTDANGNEKTRWQRIGHIHKTKDGSKSYITLDPMINLAAIPRKEGDDRVYVNLFDPKPREAGAQAYREASGGGRQAAPDPLDDGSDIPF